MAEANTALAATIFDLDKWHNRIANTAPKCNCRLGKVSQPQSHPLRSYCFSSSGQKSTSDGRPVLRKPWHPSHSNIPLHLCNRRPRETRLGPGPSFQGPGLTLATGTGDEGKVLNSLPMVLANGPFNDKKVDRALCSHTSCACLGFSTLMPMPRVLPMLYCATLRPSWQACLHVSINRVQSSPSSPLYVLEELNALDFALDLP